MCLRHTGRPAAAAASGSASAAAATTTWHAWESVLPDWKSHKPEKAIAANADDRSKLAAAVSSAARSYKPPASLGVPSLDDLGDVPRNLHERLALVARLQLAEYLGDAAVKPAVLEFTTTDVTAALSVAGAIVTDKGKRTAVASLVCCETERQMTWSRLEGLRFHWAVASGPKGMWELPPRGWKTLPDTTGASLRAAMRCAALLCICISFASGEERVLVGGVLAVGFVPSKPPTADQPNATHTHTRTPKIHKTVDAGGAWQSSFEKHPLPQPGGGQGPEAMYTMVLSVPLEGPLERGGVIFVLRSSLGQQTAWLKDAATKSDFFLPVQQFTAV